MALPKRNFKRMPGICRGNLVPALLETQRLITHQEAQKLIPEGVELTANDYLLGLFDLTGEMMRFGITSMATHGVLPRGTGSNGNESKDILVDLRSLRTSFES